MFICPGCGAGMRFDIASQKMKCDYCGAEAEPVEGEGAEAKEDEYDVTVFTCPQCGGEIMSTGKEASSFCSFCGASVVMEGRLTNERRPSWIIPFMKTKEDCQQKYAGMTRKFLFAPGEMRHPEQLDKFVGIYLPFWRFTFKQQGDVQLNGERKSGNYLEEVEVTANIDTEYDGITYDASSSFDDRLGDEVAPFEKKFEKPFSTAYLAGFFADTADVPAEVYSRSAADRANKDTLRMIRRSYPGVTFDEPENLSGRLHTKRTDLSMALYPVWFMTWRKDDRVAYAVMNGVNGNISADMPVDKRKYLLGSLILALPLFYLLTALPTILAYQLLGLAMVMAIVCTAVYAVSLNKIREREEHVGDLGWQFRYGQSPVGPSGEVSETVRAGEVIYRRAGGQTAKKLKNPGADLFDLFKRADLMTKLHAAAPVTAMIIGFIILLLKPVSDIPYYAGAILVLAANCFTLLGLIDKYNILSTRAVPDFHDRKGGSGS